MVSLKQKFGYFLWIIEADITIKDRTHRYRPECFPLNILFFSALDQHEVLEGYYAYFPDLHKTTFFFFFFNACFIWFLGMGDSKL